MNSRIRTRLIFKILILFPIIFLNYTLYNVTNCFWSNTEESSHLSIYIIKLEWCLFVCLYVCPDCIRREIEIRISRNVVDLFIYGANQESKQIDLTKGY